MARSSRVSLRDWKPNSENRRVLRMHDTLFERTLHNACTFKETKEFEDFCLLYFKTFHGAHTMPANRLEHILKEKTLTHIIEYRKDTQLVGYVFLVADNKMSHVWFYFYSPEFAKRSFGMWFLLNEARIAKKENKNYFYIGTTYGDKSRYKTNFSNLEFWDGEKWIQDKNNKEVKSRIKNDNANLIDKTDKFKSEKRNYFES